MDNNLCFHSRSMINSTFAQFTLILVYWNISSLQLQTHNKHWTQWKKSFALTPSTRDLLSEHKKKYHNTAPCRSYLERIFEKTKLFLLNEFHEIRITKKKDIQIRWNGVDILQMNVKQQNQNNVFSILIYNPCNFRTMIKRASPCQENSLGFK